MLALRTSKGRPLDLLPGTTLSLEQHNYLLADSDDNGSYSLPFTAPRSPANQAALDFPELLDHALGQARSYDNVDLFDDGRHLLSGTLRLLRSTATGYELSLSYGASVVMNKLKACRLRDLALGGIRVWKQGDDVQHYYEQLAQHMNEVAADPASYDYVFAPYSNNDALADNPENWPRYANVNNWDLSIDTATNTVHPAFRVTSGYVPGYASPGLAASPFPDFYPYYKLTACPSVKLRYLVETMLVELGIILEGDFFDAETSSLVVVGAALAEDYLITGFTRAQQAGIAQGEFWFRLADVLPDITGAELLRTLADTFFLDISVSPLGVLRLRRSQVLLTLPPAQVLTRAATPVPEVDVSADLPHLLTSYRVEADNYTSTRYQVVDPNQLGEAVATVANLPLLPDFPHQVRLVTSEDAYYQYDDTKWVFYSEHLDTPTFGVNPSETEITVQQGIELMLEVTGPTSYVLPVPGGKWPIDTPQPSYLPVLRVPTFGQRAYAPSYNCIERSQAVRLAFYRGMQPFQDATQGSYPMLSASNRNLQGQAIGSYALRLDGPAGTVAQFGAAVLPLKANPYYVKWNVWLSEEQFYQLDMARKLEIDGQLFAVRKCSLTFPIRQPAELELVIMPPALNLPYWH